MAGETVWPNTLNERVETIVKLREGIEPPLILLHGQRFFIERSSLNRSITVPQVEEVPFMLLHH